jgi:hypothetical protein
MRVQEERSSRALFHSGPAFVRCSLRLWAATKSAHRAVLADALVSIRCYDLELSGRSAPIRLYFMSHRSCKSHIASIRRYFPSAFKFPCFGRLDLQSGAGAKAIAMENPGAPRRLYSITEWFSNWRTR